MKKKLVIVGCGGLGLEVLSLLLPSESCLTSSEGSSIEAYEVVGFYDDGEPRSSHADKIYGSNLQYFSSLHGIPENACFVVAVGDPVNRQELFRKFMSAGFQPVTLIHNSAVVNPTAIIGLGCILCPHTFVGPFSEIGQNTIINNYSSVGHDAKIGESSVLHPYAALSGFASCGPYSLIATRATILVSVRLGAYSKLSAGSILTTDTKDGSLATGSPAKHRVMFKNPIKTEFE